MSATPTPSGKRYASVGELVATLDAAVITAYIANIEAELASANAELADHAEDWAVCGIPPDSLTAKLLVANDEIRRLKAELRESRAKAFDEAAEIAKSEDACYLGRFFKTKADLIRKELE